MSLRPELQPGEGSSSSLFLPEATRQREVLPAGQPSVKGTLKPMSRPRHQFSGGEDQRWQEAPTSSCSLAPVVPEPLLCPPPHECLQDSSAPHFQEGSQGEQLVGSSGSGTSRSLVCTSSALPGRRGFPLHSGQKASGNRENP